MRSLAGILSDAGNGNRMCDCGGIGLYLGGALEVGVRKTSAIGLGSLGSPSLLAVLDVVFRFVLMLVIII